MSEETVATVTDEDPFAIPGAVESTSAPSINVEIIVTLPDGTKKSENWEYEDLSRLADDPGSLIADIQLDVGNYLEDNGIFDDVELDDEADDDDDEDGDDDDEDDELDDEEGGPNDVADFVAHDAAVGMPGFTRVD